LQVKSKIKKATGVKRVRWIGF